MAGRSSWLPISEDPKVGDADVELEEIRRGFRRFRTSDKPPEWVS